MNLWGWITVISCGQRNGSTMVTSLITLPQSNLVAMFFIAAFIWRIGPWTIRCNWNCSDHREVDKMAFRSAFCLKLCYDEEVTTLKEWRLPAGSSKTGNKVHNWQRNKRRHCLGAFTSRPCQHALGNSQYTIPGGTLWPCWPHNKKLLYHLGFNCLPSKKG